MNDRCHRCRSRTCNRDGTCTTWRSRQRGHCDGPGHKGGPTSWRTCAKCGKLKANQAYKIGTDTCRACVNLAEKGTLYERKVKRVSEHRTIEVRHSRVPFHLHMEYVGASEEDFALVRRALLRWGKPNPCADEVIEEYVRTHPTKVSAADLRHATVLAANEQAIRGKVYKDKRFPNGRRAA